MKDLKTAQELLIKYKTNLKENNNIFTDEMLENLIEAARLGSDEAMYDVYWNWAFERYNVYNKNAFSYNLTDEEALYYLYESAKTYELAEVKIAENYLKGDWGFKKDEEKGVELLNIAIKKGSLIAKAELGVYLLKKDYLKAKALIEDACFDKQNDSFNCFEDAYQWLFLESFYKKNDIDLAEKYKEDIIKHDHKKLVNLIFDLADYYMYGELNEEKAYKTYKEAKDLVNFNGSIEHFVYDSYSNGYINGGYSIESDYGLSGDLSLKEKAFQFKEYAFNLEDDVTIVFNKWLDSLPYNLWLTINDSFVLNPKNKEEKNIDKSISYLDRIKTIDSDFGYDCFLGITYALYNDLKAKEILLRYINKIDEKAYLDYLNKVLNKLDYHRPNKLIKTNKNEFFYVVDEYDDKNLINTRIACFLLGMVLQKVEPDEAIKYYLKSEFSNAYTIVGKMYFSGRDIKKNLNEAIKYLEIAKSRHEKVDEELSFSYRYREVKTDEDEIVESLDNDKIVFENYNKKIPDIFISWYHKTQNEKNAVRKYFEKNYLVFDSDLDAKGDLDECIKDAIQLSKTFILMINYDSVMWANYVPLEVTQILRRVAKGELAKENINVLIIASPDHPVNDVNKALSIKAQESISKYAKDCCIDESNAYNTFIKELINNESIIQEYKYMGYYFINTLAQSYIVLDMNEPQYCFDKLDVCLNEGIYNYIIHEYKKGLKEKYPRFQYAFSDYMDDESNIPMFINFNSGFIEKKLLKNNKLYMLKEIDYSKNIFIYGRGGSGKSLLLKYIQMNYLNDLSFYLPITEIEEYMENGFNSI
ncbi:MAG: hypothetical protein K6F59_04710, partial [Gammaproteobacteria bacterium]|nr:hypothetical protein [Gammaproteobacteria bacterium]